MTATTIAVSDPGRQGTSHASSPSSGAFGPPGIPSSNRPGIRPGMAGSDWRRRPRSMGYVGSMIPFQATITGGPACRPCSSCVLLPGLIERGAAVPAPAAAALKSRQESNSQMEGEVSVPSLRRSSRAR